MIVNGSFNAPRHMTTLVKSTHSPGARRRNSRLRALSSEWGPETGMVQTVAKVKRGVANNKSNISDTNNVILILLFHPPLLAGG